MHRAATIALVKHLRRFKLTKRRRAMPRQLQPNGIRLEYFKALRRLVQRAHAMVVSDLLPELGAILAERSDSIRVDAGGKRINATMDRISKRFYNENLHPKEVEALAESFADRTANFQKDQLDKQVRSALGVDVLGGDADLTSITEDFVAENVALIKSLPSTYFSDIEKTVTMGVRQGQRHEEIAADLTDRLGVAESRAKLIARDQVGKFYGALNQTRQEKLGVTGYIWRTSNDNRVREEHEVREGETFQWSDPPEDGAPGEAINCRCCAEPDLSAFLDE